MPPTREVALQRLANANAAKAAKRLARAKAAADAAFVTAPPQPENVAPLTETPAPVGVEESALGVGSSAVGTVALVSEERLVEAGWSREHQKLALKLLLDTLYLLLNDSNANIRVKAAVELASILGVKVSKQPEAQRIKKHVQLVESDFARPLSPADPVIDRPVTDSGVPPGAA